MTCEALQPYNYGLADKRLAFEHVMDLCRLTCFKAPRMERTSAAALPAMIMARAIRKVDGNLIVNTFDGESTMDFGLTGSKCCNMENRL